MTTIQCRKRLEVNVLAAALLAAAMFAAPIVHAQIVPPAEMQDVDMVGLGIGSAPDFMGSSHNKAGAAPIFRYQFPGMQRYILWLGPQLQINLVDDSAWRFGPIVNYRFRRDSGVDDQTVKRMVPIDGKAEGGLFLQYNYKLSQAPMHQLVFSGDVEGSSFGTVGNLKFMWWKPLRQTTVLNLGFGATYGNNRWTNTYFGITNPADIVLYPSLAGRPYNAGGGVKGGNVILGLSQALTREWLLSGGVRYEQLQGDAKDSPIVTQHGKSSQVVYGVGLTYLF